KGGKAIYKTGKTLIAAEHALDAYKTTKAMDALKMTEMGAYGFVAANGFGEAVTGRDMFGNQLSEEKRKQSLMSAVTMLGVGGMGHYLDRVHTGKMPVSYSPVNRSKADKKVTDIIDSTNRTVEKVSPSADVVTYRRVQGGIPPNASRVRINIDKNGRVSIPNKKANLNISAGNAEHAQYFLKKRGNEAEIVEFDVPKWFDDFIKEHAIPQKGYKSNPKNQGGTAPKTVDPTTPGTSYEVPAPWMEWIEEYAANGRIIKNE
ncbi:hypothetical protein MOB62_21285, partial [Bacillus haynesii]|nr:hypothetical protein [Bacillus haynesii]